MMIQETIVIGIVAVATGVALYRLVRFFVNPFRKCEGCGSNCQGCALDDLKKELSAKKNSGLIHTTKKV